MGQIIGSAAKPKRCNLNRLSQFGIPAAGEHILVSSDNSMNAAGQGNFDCYIVGNGKTAASELEIFPINETLNIQVTPASIGTNKFDISACTDDVRLIAGSGAEYGATGHKASDYMNVEGQTKVTVSFSVSISSGFVCCWYDETKTYVSGASQTISTKDSTTGRYYLVLDVPATAKYMRCSSQLFSSRLFMMEYGQTPSAYEAYHYIPGTNEISLKESLMPVEYDIVKSASVGGALSRISQALASNGSIELEQNSVKQFVLQFYGKFSSFSGILIGRGASGTHTEYIKVDGTNIVIYTNGAQGGSVAHGLTISEYISVQLIVKPNCDYTIKIDTLGGTYSRNFVAPSVWTGDAGKMFCTSIDTAFSLAILSFWSAYEKSKWLFGDSYVSNYSKNRWPYYLQNWGYDFTLIDGIPGENSTTGLVNWTSALGHGKPRFAIWALGMNDPDTSSAINGTWKSNTESFIADCEKYGIVPVLCTIPCVPSYRHDFKNAWIKASGYRYIDFAEAVGGETAGSSWYTGLLSSDNVHPTEDGARLLCIRALQDLPELMQP